MVPPGFDSPEGSKRLSNHKFRIMLKCSYFEVGQEKPTTINQDEAVKMFTDWYYKQSHQFTQKERFNLVHHFIYSGRGLNASIDSFKDGSCLDMREVLRECKWVLLADSGITGKHVELV